MTTYELMLLIAPSSDMTHEKAQRDVVEKLVGEKVSVKSVTSLGKKKLAYPITKQTEATYLVAVLEGSIKSGDLDKKAKLMDDVLRLLLTVNG